MANLKNYLFHHYHHYHHHHHHRSDDDDNDDNCVFFQLFNESCLFSSSSSTDNNLVVIIKCQDSIECPERLRLNKQHQTCRPLSLQHMHLPRSDNDVVVPESRIALTPAQEQNLQQTVDPLREDNNEGIDIYRATVEIVSNLLST